MEAMYDWSVPRRQPGAAIIIVLQKVLLQSFRIVWPILLVWIFNSKKDGGSKTAFYFLSISGFILIAALLEYWYFRFSIPAGELVVKRGVFVKKTIVLPLQKIQAIHIEQNWLHRLLNLSQVSFDSPGAKDAEVKIAMSKKSAEALRSYILGNTQGMEQTAEMETIAPQSPPFFIMEPFDLLKLGISANHLEAFFILLAFGFSVLDDIETIIGQQFEGAMNWVGEQAEASTVSAVIMFSVVALLISIIVSFVRIVLRYANFRISRTARGFSIQSGLINTKEKLVPFRKVQFISWRANWIRNKMKFYLLQFHSIGTTDTRRRWEIKVPVTRPSLLPELLKEYHTEVPSAAPAMRIHPAYVFRRTIFLGFMPGLFFAAISYSSFGPGSFWFLLLTVAVFLYSWLFQRKFRFYIDKEAVQVHRPVFGKEEILLMWNRVQSVKVRQSIFQRKRGLASVLLYTAGGIVHVPFISLAQAQQIRDYALYKVETDKNNSWM